jgi:NitT/TauT family transport system permease protein
LTGFTVIGITIDIFYSWVRMIIALGLSILFSLTIGILAARNKRAEAVIIPLLDIFQSIPILGFFPIVILGIIAVIPPAQGGVDLAVIVLIFTSMSWNIAFGVYEAVKSIPQDYIDLSSLTNAGSWYRITSLYIPASFSRIAYNAQISWAVGLFYLVSSEILTLGNSTFSATHGIGVAIMTFYNAGDLTGYAYSLVALVVAVVIWQFVFLREFSLGAERYKFVEESRSLRKDTLMKFYSSVTQRSISKLFLLTQGRGVTRFSSSLYRFRRGIKYSLLILLIIFVALELSVALNSGAAQLRLPSLSAIIATEIPVLEALAFSFVRIWYIYFICVTVGLPLGIAIALSKKAYDAATPILEIIASIPAPALLPIIAVVAASSGEAVAAVIIFLAMIWYVVFNVMAGVRTLPSDFFELKKGYHITTIQAWRNVYIPSSMTAFVTGSITAVGAAWNALIVAEYFSINGGTPLTQVGMGIGKVIAVATNNGDLLTLTLAVLSMTGLIVAFNLTVWRRVYHYTTRRYAYNR